MKIVKFKNGKYGIRKGWFFYKYMDLNIPTLEWSIDDGFFKECLSTDLDKVKKVYNRLTDYGTPIDED